MAQDIRLGAILARDGHLLLVRDESGSWTLPGGPLRADHEDVDLGMAEYLLDFGVRIPDIEEAFLQTAYVPHPAGGHTVLNLYAPAEWEGDPEHGPREPTWHEIEALAQTGMDPGLRHALLTAFGLAPDDTDAQLSQVLAGADVSPPAQDSGLRTEDSHYDWFIASRWRNAEAVDALAGRMRDAGLRVYCFRDAGDDWNVGARERDAGEYMADFEARDWRTDPLIQRVFDEDIAALRESAALVLLLPAGNSSHMEAGIAYGMGKPCVLVGETPEAESLYLIFQHHYPTPEAFLEALR